MNFSGILTAGISFSGHRNFSSDCDLGRILFYETVLAGFPCGRGDLPRTFCMLRSGKCPSVFLGVLGCTFLWSIQELYEQEERVKRAGFGKFESTKIE